MKKRRINFKYSKEEVLGFLKTNIATSILIGLVLLFITIGNSFVVGALIGGYLGAKQLEKSSKDFSTAHLVLGASVGAVLGGSILIFSVAIGRFFYMIGSMLGAIAGCGAVIVFSGEMTGKITHKVMDSPIMSRVLEKNIKKK
jgi:hypothetical protein